MKTVIATSFVLLCATTASAQTPSQTFKGLEFTVAGVTRETNVSLADCPAGANSVRGVIKPGDTTEFAAVKVDFNVTRSFKAGPLPKPVLSGEGGKTFNTAQSFADVGGTPSFSCTFYYRVPKGAKVTKFAIENVAIDVTKLNP